MSSRALRKLQKQKEAQKVSEVQNDSEDSEPDIPVSRPKINAFDLLGDQDEDDDNHDNAHESETEKPVTEEDHKPVSPLEAPKSTSGNKKKKKKSKKQQAKKTTEPAEANTPGSKSPEVDEIDLALEALALKHPPSSEDQNAKPEGDLHDSYEQSLCALLEIDAKKLVAMNEMKRLFGNAAVENRTSESPSGNRRRERNRRALDLGAALTGRYSPASRGQDLSGVALRKNVLMQGKAEWPKATSGGLAMEIVQKSPMGAVEYEIVHNTAYKDVQRQFEMCVESMQPERMIELLQYNPYHISTLLQVSEIAKHQGDHAVSADLLERALFNIGRSAQSSFGNSLKEGKARLDFTIKENREVWLAGWRYIINLGMKGTWKTAYEWTKFLLSLDPDDPYCLCLIIDHIAIRARELEHFVDLCLHPSFKKRWHSFPNIQCSLSLAYMYLKKPKECREILHSAMAQYPWIFCRLTQELNVSPVPTAIWGAQAPDAAHELLCELYIARAKDIWNTPEATSLLVEIADSIAAPEQAPKAPEISQNVARHVILSDISAVTTHLPRHFTVRQISASDPLPPNEVGLSNVHAASMLDEVLQLFGANEPAHAQTGRHSHRHVDDDEDTDSAEELDMAGVYLPPSQAPEWLLAEGADELAEFFLVNGVDPGNWEEGVDMLPVQRWVRNLQHLDRQEWHRIISTVAAGLGSSAEMIEMVLREELERQISAS
ncbi:transcription factor 25 [Nannizzia gypsea CBS 118893]|uniref:Transcription factor 25 n=1 Tax=Arthroderma gypseum (strain ATCC MYA-4604 / CBS 118893) TaxID=535722 RepID=E5R1A2_ARTGP|nr:transcription factor 25 [Nannizzia gypsea CBS 118893]EFQ98491.1 transcription factor 25 [Nannizzia gypsea CBS 118893]